MKTSLVQHFEGLSNWLSQHRVLWSSQPYLKEALAWEKQYPLLSTQLRELSDTDLDNYERTAELLPIEHSEWRKWWLESKYFVKLDNVSAVSELRRPNDIKARKWLQIHAFVNGVLLHAKAKHWIDWCGGKGHLLRSFANCANVSGAVFERDSVLCQAGSGLASSRHSINFYALDVLKDVLPPPRTAATGVMALHACGQLTDRAIQYALAHQLEALALVPCCYHHQPIDWQPSSQLGRKLNIELTKHCMRLPSLLEHSLRERRRKLRYQQLVYRLAFQALFQLAQKPVPPLPSLPRRFFYLDFNVFCEVTSEHLELQLPDHHLQSRALEIGQQRAGLARRQGIVHAPFRRAIELWINLDRALHIAANGFRVELKTLCETTVTPRNMVIFADRR